MRTIKDTTLLAKDCDRSTLLELLRDGENACNHDAAVEHLEQCMACQQAYDEMAAASEDWDTAREVLQANDWPTQAQDLTQRWYGHLDNERQAVDWTEQMARQLLSPPSHPEMLGRIGRYEIERLIGSGGMGVVFKAIDTELNRQVALKLLAPYLAGNGPARKRFAREARAAAAIVHDHVVPIHNVEAEREVPFLVMQYIGGESLQSRIDRQGALDLCEILRIGMQVASGLAAAHQQGLVHRDIKPSNILLEPTIDRAFITDFGLARAVDDASLTRTGFHPGTPQYMSPEQAAGEIVDARSDLFSLGSVLYTMCTGRPPFRADTSLGVMRRIADDHPRAIQEINPNMPTWLCKLVNKLMAKQPEDRYSSAAEVAMLLEQCLAHVQQPAAIALPQELLQPASKYRRAFHRGMVGVATLTAAWLMWLAGSAIYLEYDKGTLRIESNSDANIPIRIKQNDKTVEELTVCSDASSIRLRAGKYTIEVDDDSASIDVVGDDFTIKRGDTWIAKLQLKKKPLAGGSDNAPTEIGALFGGQSMRRWPDNDLPDSSTSIDLMNAVDKGLRDRLTPKQTPYSVLEKAIQLFNNEYGSVLESLGCSLLTKNEVLAALSWKIEHGELGFEHRKILEDMRRNAIDGRCLFTYSLVDSNRTKDIPSVRIHLIDRGLDITVPIRRQMYSPPKEFLTATETTTDETSRPLEAAIKEFNNTNTQLNGQAQPPLTMNEVLAAIVDWSSRRNEAPVDDATFENFQRIARTHRLPADTKFELISSFGGAGQPTYYIWSVRILMPQVAKPGWTYAFTIRNQFVGMESISLDEIHWGTPGKSGLQAGFRLKPALKTYTDGQEVEVEFLYRSITGKPIPASVPNVFYFHKIKTAHKNGGESTGDKSELVVGGWRAESIAETPTIFQGKKLKVCSPGWPHEEGVTKLVLSLRHSTKVSFIVPDFADGEEGVLITGEVELNITGVRERTSIERALQFLGSLYPKEPKSDPRYHPPLDMHKSDGSPSDSVPPHPLALNENLDETASAVAEPLPSLLSQMQGTWEITKIFDEGVDALGQFSDRKAAIIVAGSLLSVRGTHVKSGQSIDIPLELHLDDKNSRHVDIVFDPNDKDRLCRLPGVIEVDGDTLRLCCRCDCGATDEQRPQHFAPGTNIWYYEAKRK